jgi:predicted CXXCH cytochrome family protein
MTTRATRIIGICAVAAAGLTALPAGARDGLPGYAGVKLCGACHKKTNEKIVTAQATTPHALALWAIAEQGDQRKVLGDFGAGPGFKSADAAWVLGKGNRAQAYLDAKLNALPKEWDVTDKSWDPGQTGDAKKSCLGCHTTGYDVASSQWSDEGVTCEACHGPGANHAKSSAADKKTTIGHPDALAPDRQAMICGRCHSRGKGADGLPFAAGFMPGDDLSKVFTLDADTELGGRNTQYNDLASGKHLAKGLACTTCHDPHGTSDIEHQLLKPADDLCAGCHPKDKLAGPQHAPAEDCVRCHMPKGAHRFEHPENVPAGTPHHHHG